MNLGIKLGLKSDVLAEVINASTGKCWPSEINNPVPGICPNAPASRQYVGGFGIKLMRKDLRLASQAGFKAGAKFILASKAQETYNSLSNLAETADKDFSVVYTTLQ
jgi:3-hydroxyisobutyrate dehydrogenase-like beta-hydroxyacid dehydrogenase